MVKGINQERLASILDNIADGVITINDKGIIEAANLSTAKIFGYSAKELMSSKFDFMSIVEPESQQIIKDRRKALRTGKSVPSRFEFKGITKSKEMKDFEAIQSPIYL